MPFVSIIIPCYNSAKFISRCLEALRKQSYKDYDVIFIDDCSTDDTVEIISDYISKGHLKGTVLRNSKNSGPAYSRNKGIAVADGNYIAFCDSDDWYDDDYLQHMVDAARRNNSDIVFCNSRKVLPNGKKIEAGKKSASVHSLSTHDVLLMGVDSLWSLMVKKAIIANIPQPDIRNGEDMAIIPLLIMNSSIFSVADTAYYNYYCRPGSLSLNTSLKVVNSLIISFDYIYLHQKEGFEKEIEFIGIKNVIYGALLNLYKCSYDNFEAQKIIGNFEHFYPKWYDNEFISMLPIYKRLFIFFVRKRLYLGVKILASVHKLIFKA